MCLNTMFFVVVRDLMGDQQENDRNSYLHHSFLITTPLNRIQFCSYQSYELHSKRKLEKNLDSLRFLDLPASRILFFYKLLVEEEMQQGGECHAEAFV